MASSSRQYAAMYIRDLVGSRSLYTAPPRNPSRLVTVGHAFSAIQAENAGTPSGTTSDSNTRAIITSPVLFGSQTRPINHIKLGSNALFTRRRAPPGGVLLAHSCR